MCFSGLGAVTTPNVYRAVGNCLMTTDSCAARPQRARVTVAIACVNCADRARRPIWWACGGASLGRADRVDRAAREHLAGRTLLVLVQRERLAGDRRDTAQHE